MQRQMEERLPRPSGGRRRLTQLLSALRYDLSWRFARPGAFRQLFEQAIANLPQGICLYDSDDRLQLVNEQFGRIYNQPMHSIDFPPSPSALAICGRRRAVPSGYARLIHRRNHSSSRTTSRQARIVRWQLTRSG